MFQVTDMAKAVRFYRETLGLTQGVDTEESAEEWRYYRDGKNWLMKVARKSRTVFWLSVCRGCFQITFYLSDKAEGLIQQSDLPPDLKESFIHGKRYGKIRGVTVVFRKKSDIRYAESLIGIRLKT